MAGRERAKSPEVLSPVAGREMTVRLVDLGGVGLIPRRRLLTLHNLEPIERINVPKP